MVADEVDFVVGVDTHGDQHALEVDPALRASDAIHLATAVLMGDDLDAFVCYDARLAAAAKQAGLAVAAPAA